MSRSKGYKCFNIKCGSCIGKTLCGEPEDTALGCVGRIVGKPITNADRIRAMSDEEIAEYVCRNSINTLCDIICGGECNAISTLKRSGDWACKEIVMKWLQQPAEDDDHSICGATNLPCIRCNPGGCDNRKEGADNGS